MRGGSGGAVVSLGGGATIDVAASRSSRIEDGVILESDQMCGWSYFYNLYPILYNLYLYIYIYIYLNIYNLILPHFFVLKIKGVNYMLSS